MGVAVDDVVIVVGYVVVVAEYAVVAIVLCSPFGVLCICLCWFCCYC